MLRRQEELENGTAWSISSESSDDSSSPQLSGSTRHASHKPIVQPEVQVSAPAIEIAFSQQEEAGAAAEPPSRQEEPGSARKEVVANGHVPYSRTLSHISESSLDAAVDCREGPSAHRDPSPVPQDPSTGELPPLEMDTLPEASNLLVPWTGPDRGPEAEACGAVSQAEACEPVVGRAEATVCQALGPQGHEVSPDRPVVLHPVSEERGRLAPAQLLPTSPAEVPRPKPVDCGLEEAIGSLCSALDDYRGQFPELQPLERELKRLEEILMHKQRVFLSRASSMSLTVEHALESFSFLNTSDMDDSEGSEEEEASRSE
ncbi:rho family-interacting cell polarization regulator 1-like, partial [Chelonoidis abingdonii]|uniref:rho family-interacting cell polarization regulator 1-like n=1 Tax=Chelonoidis abingdonii TaxID=106734 RepID=UPI003F4988A6